MPRGSHDNSKAGPKVVCIGETMLMLAPRGHGLLEQAGSLAVSLAGSEVNVAIGLERLGVHSSWIGRLPRNPLGRRVAQEIRSYGVDTSGVVWSDGGRLGLLFFEHGASPRPSSTLYDRAYSAATRLEAGELGWDHVLRAQWVHLSGISLALGPECRASTCEIMRRAHDLGLLVSFDLNYRALLWNPHEAREAWQEVLPFVDLLVSTRKDAQLLLNTGLNPADALRKLLSQHPHRAAVITLGEDGAVGFDGRSLCTAPGFRVRMVNRLGAGDAFVAGLLYGYVNAGLESGLNYGTAMAALKMTMPGNVPLVAREQVESLIAGTAVDLVR